MRPCKPPAPVAERLANLIEGLASLGDDDDPSDEEIGAELAARGVNVTAWAARIRARAVTRPGAERRGREEAGRASCANDVAWAPPAPPAE